MLGSCEIGAGVLPHGSTFSETCRGRGRSSGLWDGREQLLCLASARRPAFCAGCSPADCGHRDPSLGLGWWALRGPASHASSGCAEPCATSWDDTAHAVTPKPWPALRPLLFTFQVICIPAGHGLAFSWLGNSRAKHSYEKLLTSLGLKSLLCNYSWVVSFPLRGMLSYL